jgi:hypothetical protein
MKYVAAQDIHDFWCVYEKQEMERPDHCRECILIMMADKYEDKGEATAVNIAELLSLNASVSYE